nr:hypothetical protein [uncultured Pseudomonas sp.]
MELGIALALALGLFILGQWLTRRAARQHQNTLDHLQYTTLQRSLELLPAVQMHRDLGAQQDIGSVSQRNALARKLDKLWLNWPGESLQLAPLHKDWPQLRRKPADFEAHCQMIEALLIVIEQLEDHLCLTTWPQLQGLAIACHSLEDLARLRGLALRATNYRRCPAGLKMQMQLLCQRLQRLVTSLPIGDLLLRLQEDLIDAPQARITAQDCVALFGPLLDAQIERVQRC